MENTIKGKLSKELTHIFEYIRDVICMERDHVAINETCFILSVLKNENSLAYQTLSSLVLESTLDNMKEFYDYSISYTTNDLDDNKSPYSIFDPYVEECLELYKELNLTHITSSILLLTIVKTNEEISKQFRDFGITSIQILNNIRNQCKVSNLPTTIEPVKKHKKKKSKSVEVTQPVKIIEVREDDENVNRNLVDLTKLASLGKIPQVLYYDKIYEDIFAILSKKECNNVAICGKSGVGKTATAMNIANLILNKKCHPNFHDKKVYLLDFSKLVCGAFYKGAFEQKFYSIIEDAKKCGNNIFIIDNLHLVINSNTKYAETDVESLLASLFADESIQSICTMTEKSYRNLRAKTTLGKYLQDVVIEEPSEEIAIQILNCVKDVYERFHDVIFTENAIIELVKLCKKYLTNSSLPESAIGMIDLIGAKTNLLYQENSEITKLTEELQQISEEIDTIKTTSLVKEYDKIDGLVKKQIAIKSQIAIAEKEMMFSKEPTSIHKNDICKFMSQKVDVPLEDITLSEKERLKNLNTQLSSTVVGQDEAVNELCRVVKRQRIGLGDNERPAVLLFLGSTGVGKTYLAKQLAKEVFGDEKYFVRMDMSEYADKISVNKITGSSPGYIGFGEDTQLLKALKTKKRFVLLLDEFEKSDQSVHNLFLQMFDEGRFTDSNAETHSLKDVIIILTSNVGVSEALSRGAAIGFNKDSFDMSRTIIEKEMKKKFKPEFLNRIQKIIYFNNLTDDNLRDVIRLEISKIEKKITKLGHHLDESLTNGTMIDKIFESIKDKKEYGARPIVNEVQREIEDKIVDYIIDNELDGSLTFTYEMLQ